MSLGESSLGRTGQFVGFVMLRLKLISKSPMESMMQLTFKPNRKPPLKPRPSTYNDLCY